MPELGIAGGDGIQVGGNVLTGKDQLAGAVGLRQKLLQQVQPEGVAKFAPALLFIAPQQPLQRVNLHPAGLATEALQQVMEQIGGVLLIRQGGFFAQGAEQCRATAGKVGGEAAIVQAEAVVR